MSKERNDLKEAANDQIKLGYQYLRQKHLKLWDQWIAFGGMISCVIPFVETDSASLLFRLFGTGLVIGGGFGMGILRDTRIANISRQMERIERQVQRTVSLQNSVTS